MQSTRKQRKRLNRPRRKVTTSISTVGPFTPGVPDLIMTIPEVLPIASVAATATYAVSSPIQAGMMNSFATRFVAFDEYRIISCKFKFYPLGTNPGNSTGTGYADCWVEPLSTAAPTSATASQNVTVTVPLAQTGQPRPYVFHYKPKDFTLLEFQPIATTTYVIGNLKVYTDMANYGNTITTGNLLFIRAEFVVQFRGLA